MYLSTKIPQKERINSQFLAREFSRKLQEQVAHFPDQTE